MKRRTIEIIVHAAGSLQLEAVGYQGADCERATQFLEEALGTVQKKQRKPEYYRQVQRKQIQKLGL